MEASPVLTPISTASAAVAARPIPASSGQRRLWFLEQMEPGSPLYNIPYLVRLSGPLNERALDRALATVVERHEAIRTMFVAVGSEPMQVIKTSWSLDLPVTDISNVPANAREAELMRLVGEEAKKPFNLQKDLLLRVRLIRLAATEHALMLVMHHIASDGWSMGILYKEIGICYDALANDQEPKLSELPVQYGDFSEWQHEYLQGETLGKLKQYWKKQITGAPALLELPTDHARPPLQSHTGDTVTVQFSPALVTKLRQLSQQNRVTFFMTLLAGFNAVLHRYTGQSDLVIGSPLAGRDAAETEEIVGFFINTILMRTNLAGDPTVTELLARVRDVSLAAFEHREMPYEKLVEELQPQRNLSFDPICQVYFALQNMPMAPLKLSGIKLSIEPVYTGTAKSDLTVWAIEQADGSLSVTAEYALDLFQRETIQRFLGHFQTVLEGMAADPARKISQLPLLTAEERQRSLGEWNATATDYPRDRCIHQLFEEQVARTPQSTALVFDETELTFEQLNTRADRLAAQLRTQGVGPDVLVGICVERSIDMMVGLLGIHKAGGAYLPLDPTYPKERIGFMLHDSQAPVLVSQLSLLRKLPPHQAAVICLDDDGSATPRGTNSPEATEGGRAPTADNLAYVLYTSGSTGNPKGVMVTHRNVVNFFAGMDQALGTKPVRPAQGPEWVEGPGVWLAVTSISFDISVLELFWTLTRGFKVVVLSDAAKLPGMAEAKRAVATKKPLDFSLFYFASVDDSGDADPNRYRLLLEGAKFADQHGFKAVWTPERHFHSFGGLYPNPAVVGAALAAVTQKVQIRAGSVVSPLHHPLRVAEEWSVVDNLSHGRAGVSFANGWHDRDFTLRPENYADRRNQMRRDMETVRKLWRGEAVEFPGGRGNPVPVKIYPRPIQQELPMWITAAGNPDTFKLAGQMGAGVLTHLLGQELDELAKKIKIYRQARRDAGHDDGCVTIALHTFVGEDLQQVKEKVHDPLCRYLADSVDLLQGLTQALYPGAEMKSLKPEEKEALIEYSFNRYFELCGLLGTPETCRKILARLSSIGIDEIACLIDFGVDVDSALVSLKLLDRVRSECQEQAAGAELAAARASSRTVSLVEQMQRHRVTHLQCTPSFARLLLQSLDTAEALRSLKKLMVGGEALPVGLAEELVGVVSGEVINMYGPTETTIWSTTHRVTNEPSSTGAVAIGRPLANQQVYVLDGNRQPLPVGVPGELWIAGDGVARGYWKRPELTAEKFVPDPFVEDMAEKDQGPRTKDQGPEITDQGPETRDQRQSPEPKTQNPEPKTQNGASSAAVPRMYRTGDLVRYRADGVVDFLGRVDHQVKIRGHRIELGEIEAALMQHSDVRQAVVVLRRDNPDDPQLAAYVVAAGDEAPAANALRDFLRQKLPDHMVPALYVTLDQLPLTPNGKVDRKALPAPQGSRVKSEASFVPPKGGVEQAVAVIWKDILHVDQIGVDDNFFDFGGHSLQVVQVQNRLREALNVDVPVLKLFQFPTIRMLAKFIGEQSSTGPKDDSFRQKIEERNKLRQGAMIRRRAMATPATTT
ncbi:MAG: LLM class flavin-dependent oxidoreductase [Opitutaceae bacterium]|nr:LLM class flavin-dependent oxidoreductase [Opitutaceae bacterium]